MIFDEISESIKTQKNLLKKLELEFQEFSKVTNNRTFLLSKENHSKYLDLESKLKMAVNKKRKEIEKEMQLIRDKSKEWLYEIEYYSKLNNLDETIDSERKQLTYLAGYITNNIEQVYNILIHKHFIDKESLQLNILGNNALHIREIHPLVSAILIETTKYFQDFSSVQIVGFLSTLVDIKVPEVLRSSILDTDDIIINAFMKPMIESYNDFQDLENRLNIHTGFQYDNALQFDIIDLSMQWCGCLCEVDCKIFIQTKLIEKEISIGDFTKAMMKISAICKELSIIAEINNQIEWLHKLSLVDGLILKYIATNQSLYI